MSDEPATTRRRALLAAGASLVSALAGCGQTGAQGESPSTAPGTTATESPTPTATDTPTEPTAAAGDGYAVDVVATDLAAPWDATFDPEGRLYVTEVGGRLLRFRPGEDPTALARLESTKAVNEAGLLGVALHPSFPEPPSVFVYQSYGDDGLRNRVLRFRVDDGGLTDRRTVLDGLPGAENHDGGRVAFGPDDRLYVTVGDTLEAPTAQEPSALTGKLLRLAPDGSVPSDNPFDGSPVWSYGHRNPQGLAWDHQTGQLYATEHGNDGHDEVNRIRPGENYGWPAVEGATDGPEYTDPVLESGENTWAPAGAAFHTGQAFGGWENDLFFCALGFSQGDGRRSLHRVAFETAGGRTVAAHETLLAGEFGRLRAVTEGPDGALYVATSNRDGRGDPGPDDDRILRVRPAGR